MYTAKITFSLSEKKSTEISIKFLFIVSDHSNSELKILTDRRA